MSPGSASSVSLSTLLGFTRFLAGTLDRVAAFTDTQIIDLLNQKQKNLQTKLLATLTSDWQENTLEGTGSGLIDITAGDNSYAFPTDMITIDRIELNLTGVTNGYRPARIVPLSSYQNGFANTTDNAPVEGDTTTPLVVVRNRIIYLDPTPNVSVTGGMKIWGKINGTDLAVGGSAPVWDAAFHEILCYDVAQTWTAAKQQNQKAQRLIQERDQKFAEMVAFYSNKDKTVQPQMTAHVRSMR